MQSDRYLLYESHHTRTCLIFDRPMFPETMPNLRENVWDYTLAARGITGVNRKTREFTITAKFLTTSDYGVDGASLVHRMLEVFDADMASGEPASLRFGTYQQVVENNGCWEASVFIPKVTFSDINPGVFEAELSIVLVDGVWRQKLETQRFAAIDVGDSTYLDLPADLPADLTSAKIIQHVNNPGFTDCEFVARVFGPAVNPQFAIGGNLYRFDNVTVPDGGYMTVTSAFGRKTITLTAENGDVTNRFDSGERGTGKGCGHYCFEHIPPGDLVVTWSGNWTLELDLYRVSGAPSWN